MHTRLLRWPAASEFEFRIKKNTASAAEKNLRNHVDVEMLQRERANIQIESFFMTTMAIILAFDISDDRKSCNRKSEINYFVVKFYLISQHKAQTDCWFFNEFYITFFHLLGSDWKTIFQADVANDQKLSYFLQSLPEKKKLRRRFRVSPRIQARESHTYGKAKRDGEKWNLWSCRNENFVLRSLICHIPIRFWNSDARCGDFYVDHLIL